MHKHFISLLTIILFVSLWAPPLAAQEQIRFYHLNTKGYNIRDVYCDVNGIIWLGTTSGPSAYQRPFADFNMSIRKISGDSKGGLWLKTLYNDVFYYNPMHNEFVKDTPKMLSEKGIEVEREFSVQTDVNGNTWIWTGNKLYWEKAQMDNFDVIEVGGDELIRTIRHSLTSLLVMTQDNLYVVSLKNKKNI